MSLMEFMREFPDDETCLRHVWRERYAPDGEHAFCQRCETERVFKRYKTAQKRPAWFCSACGFRVHPLMGTIFERSSTSLHLWFYTMYLITSTRCGISAKHLERELGVTYKTAWRMFNKIRNQLMNEDHEPLSGAVEADETFVGGKPRQSDRNRRAKLGWNAQTDYWDRKAVVFGAVERGGRIRASVVPNSRASVIAPLAQSYILPGSMVFTDEYKAYNRLGKKGYTHRRIKHHARIYVDGDVHTQTIDGFFGLFKTGVRGAHHAVSHKWLQGHLNEWTWRYNRRESGTPMFTDLLKEAVSRTV
ncbi:MAG: IS1595 family transposase [Gaiellaceae bacterium]